MWSVEFDDRRILELIRVDGIAQLRCLVGPGNRQCESWNEVIDYSWDDLGVQQSEDCQR